MKPSPLSTLFVGIDVSKNNNVASILNFNQDRLLSQSFKNDIVGTDSLITSLIQLIYQHAASHVVAILEATGFFHFHLATALATHEQLLQLNIQVFCVNPRMIKKYAESFNFQRKDDFLDARILADFARVGRTKELKPFRGAQFIGLQRLTRHRVHLSELIAKEKLYLTNNIFLKFSGLSTIEAKKENPFSTLYGVTIQDVLLSESMSPDDIIEMELDDLVAHIKSVSKNSFTDPENTSELLKQAARNSYRLDKVTNDMLAITIASSYSIINTFSKEIKLLDKSIEKMVRGLFGYQLDILISMKGIGLVTAAGILVEIQDINFFRNDGALAKYAGFIWKKSQSGDKTQELTPLTKTGNTFLNYYIKNATNQLRKYVPYFSQFYTAKYNQSVKHKHNRAINLTSRKLILRIHSMLKNGTFYSDNYVDSNHS